MDGRKTSVPSDGRYRFQIPSPTSAFPNQLGAENGGRSASMAIMKPQILTGHVSSSKRLCTTNGEHETSLACSSRPTGNSSRSKSKKRSSR